jgi:hypothetical protein
MQSVAVIIENHPRIALLQRLLHLMAMKALTRKPFLAV